MPAAGISSPAQSRLLRWLAYAAAATLCGISALANLKFGMSLGADRVDQMALGGASVAVDVLKAALPLLVLNLWRRCHRGLAIAGAVLWLGCLSWSACSAMGFAVDSRSQVNADRTMQSAASQGSMATIGRAESQLTAIGTTRPVAVVKADLAAANVPAPSGLGRRNAPPSRFQKAMPAVRLSSACAESWPSPKSPNGWSKAWPPSARACGRRSPVPVNLIRRQPPWRT